MKNITQQNIEELTLLLAYLTSWDENSKREYGTDPALRTWKGYDFDILDSLQQQEFIEQSYQAKSVYLTRKGIEKAQQLAEKFLSIDHSDLP